ncbi:MAG: flagellar type III secretion system pore protein FliP, partial [Aeromonadaceae bacterium]|nr:flagellar type III secretion system pore protein FliP [Aeromonadaceae bacterium]
MKGNWYWLLLCLVAPSLWAQTGGLSAVTITTNPDGSQEYSLTLQILALMTALTFLPSIVIMMTSFTRIIVVLSILRQAIGLQQSPSNQILIGLSLFLTLFIMAPVFDRINAEALQPYLNEQISSREAFDTAQVPLHQFMLGQTRIKDLNSFMEFANVHVDKPE